MTPFMEDFYTFPMRAYTYKTFDRLRTHAIIPGKGYIYNIYFLEHETACGGIYVLSSCFNMPGTSPNNTILP